MQARTLPILLAATVFACSAFAQHSNCDEIRGLARMARSRSLSALKTEFQKMGSDYRAHLVFATRQFELSSNDNRAAEELLNLIPTKEKEEFAAKAFGGFLCEGEPEADLRTLSALGDRISREFSRAVLLVPQKMDAYVVYAAEAVQDPHSDYALQMERVCRKKHGAFAKAVENLGDGAPEKGYFATASSEWFRKHILDPETCRALAIPEAD